ncbi:MAG: tRNA 2-thiouridine(34) synthase MnmA [Treponema sp.]|nr:tRNA 2-thiouridine(34) synthase MnmA [Treponema sp.]
MKYILQNMPEPGSTVVVGLSGGVDSTLTALLLKQKGCNVIGVTMSLWDGHIKAVEAEKKFHDSCYGPGEAEDIEECRTFCAEHGIDYHVIDVSKEYNEQVLEYFKNEYRAGKTPNPCIRCNVFIKFGALLEGIKKLDIKFDYFCTGHYAAIVRPESGIWHTDKTPCMIATANDLSKDQTYFLYRLPSQLLEKIRFPLALMKKEDVFKIAKEHNLPAADRGESQDFIGSEYFEQIFADKPSNPGDFVDMNCKVLGRHKGIEHYTIGQRRGLGVSGSEPYYVQKIDAEKNQIVLSTKEHLASGALIADDFQWPGGIEPDEAFEANVKIRLRSKDSLAVVERYDPPETDTYKYKGQPWKITFAQKQNAITPGQSAVIYSDNVVMGGGIIVKNI